MNDIHEQLFLERRRQKIHQADLAKKIGISPQMMSHLENGRRTIKLPLLEKWTDELGFMLEVSYSPKLEKLIDKK